MARALLDVLNKNQIKFKPSFKFGNDFNFFKDYLTCWEYDNFAKSTSTVVTFWKCHFVFEGCRWIQK